ncbi:MAG TPA: hypothetical protein VGQ76_04620 [Thermoanaerobaculia bacterium]|jgi:hypothetical protein|nr:hypothetical protein [Thermoanaerobaculia bacterium]
MALRKDYSEKVVRITLQDGIPVPEQDPIVLKKGAEQLRWSAPFEFQITIEGYDNLKYSTSEEFHCRTGQFDQEKRYKYTIHANGVDNDPNIDIKP